MITLTNAQITALTSPVVATLFNDSTRQFPVYDGFKLLEILDIIGNKAKIHQEAAKKIIDKYKGTIEPNGKIVYEQEESAEPALEELTELLNISVEIHADKLKVKDDWPKLSITELAILKPIIEV